MAARPLTSLAAASALSLAISACGGGGISTAFIPPPPTPTPTPAPTPTPTPVGMDLSQVQVFPNITESKNFDAIGLDADWSTGTISNSNTSVRYDAPSGLYLMKFTGAAEAPFYEFTANSPSVTWWSGETLQSNGTSPATVSVLKPTNPELKLSFTTIATYDTGGMGGGSYGWIAFGTPTSAGSVPTSGFATYNALVRGSTTGCCGYVQGAATLQFDFSSAQLSGHLDPSYIDLGGGSTPLGRYDFVNTLYATGGTNFSGQLSQAGLNGTGSFNGQFTGPSAEELMATWTAPYMNPESKTVSTMFGAWVGAK